ncbi:MAG: helix-turn-helix transcriptional regulator [Armatimonadetes bacterium]|nr:helix-turn-helix transcriptional regulator [Armatimonadota bacterium]
MALGIIREARKAAKLSLEQLADDVGLSVSQVSRIERGLRNPTYDQAKALASRLGLTIGDLDQTVTEGRRVPLAGYVGAGARAILFTEADDPELTVEAPENATDLTRAYEIRGTSLGELFDRWLVYIDDTPQKMTSLIGKLCIVELTDGRRLVKKVIKGQIPRRFTLLSNTEPPIYDAEIVWAAQVKDMRPQ